MRPRLLPQAPTRRLRGHLPTRWLRRPRLRRRYRGRHHPQDRALLHHVRQQRNRHRPTHQRSRRALPRPRRLLPHRRRTGRRQNPRRRGGPRRRPHVHLGPQAVRPQGHRRNLRPPPPAGPHRGDHQRRRTRARPPQRHPADPARRGARARVRGREGGHGLRCDAHRAARQEAVRRDHVAGRFRDPQRLEDERVPRLREPVVCVRRGREPADGAQDHRSVVGERVHLGVAGAELRAARAGRGG
mmetsp:Transcript_4290/g.11108  ORF Transcript_4290/g.11108 Transcript_4290/m.11108 type:complete len:243 (-) Transcript_4290:449-1177(-)